MKGSLLLTETAALEAAAIIAENKRGELASRFPSFFTVDGDAWTAPCRDAYERMQTACECARANGAFHIKPLGEGGIFNSLWKAAEDLGTGLTADILRIPVMQETVELCEYYDLDPYYCLSGGSLLIASSDAFSTAWALRDCGIPAVPFGVLTDSRARIIRYPSHTRYLDRPKRDELYKMYDPTALRALREKGLNLQKDRASS